LASSPIRPAALIEPGCELILILKLARYAGGRSVDVSGNYYVHPDGNCVIGSELSSFREAGLLATSILFTALKAGYRY
jgi:hypothetical protein